MSSRSYRARVVLITAAIAMMGSSSVLAQVTTSEYSKLSRRASSGDLMFVTTRTEGEIRGRLVRLSPDAIVVATEQAERTISFSDIGWIEKRGDALWNGLTIGAGLLGFSMMGGAGASCSPDCASQVPAALAVGVAVGGGIGALIDWMIPGRTLLYGTRPKGDRGILAPTPALPESGRSLASLSSRVSPGDRIAVRTTSGTDVEGRFVRASDSSIAVTDRNGLREIASGDVTEILRYRGGTHIKKGLLIGIPIGALSGSGACYGGLDEPYPSHDSGMPCGVGVLVGAAVGGAVGALIGGSTYGSTVVYSVVPHISRRSIGLVTSFAF